MFGEGGERSANLGNVCHQRMSSNSRLPDEMLTLALLQYVLYFH